MKEIIEEEEMEWSKGNEDWNKNKRMRGRWEEVKIEEKVIVKKSLSGIGREEEGEGVDDEESVEEGIESVEKKKEEGGRWKKREKDGKEEKREEREVNGWRLDKWIGNWM